MDTELVIIEEGEVIYEEQRTLTDADVLTKIERIRHLKGDARWAAFDHLVFDVINHHPHGMAADILQIVFAEWDEEVIHVME